ncbi:MAG: LysE family transporter [Massilia sp.]
MSFATWFTFVVAASIIAISPGSGAIMAMSSGLAYGLRRASATVLGLQAGLLLMFIIAGAGVGSLVMASDLAFGAAKTIGALYLIYCGITQWRAAPSGMLAAGSAVEPPSFGQRVLTGFLTNATNPKGIIFMVAVLPQFIAKDAPLLPQLAILGATMVTIDTIVMHGYAGLAASMQRYFRDPRAIRKQNHFFGGVLILVGAALFFVKRVGG